MNNNKPKLISFELCPFVQKVIIVFNEKKIEFERVFIDLAHKPKWFLDISPLGKVPLLQINGQTIFESTVICELLDELYTPRLHPDNPYLKAFNRAWIEFGSTILFALRNFSFAQDEASFKAAKDEMLNKLSHLNAQIEHHPFFNGYLFSMVDATYGPLFMRIKKMEEIYPIGLLNTLPKLEKWSENLLSHPSIKTSEIENYVHKLRKLLQSHNSYFS